MRQSLSREQAQEVEPGPRSLWVNKISNEGLSLSPVLASSARLLKIAEFRGFSSSRLLGPPASRTVHSS